MIHIYLTIINNILTDILIIFIVLLLLINILTDIFNVLPSIKN
jgi:hypothetical protein